MKPLDVSVEPSEEIREYCRMMAEYAPDVLSEDVFESLLNMFRQHGRDVVERVRTEDNGFCKNPGLP